MTTWPTLILGGTGYVAGEMLRLVLQHPQLTLAGSISMSQAGARIADAFGHLAPAIGDLRFASFDDVVDRLGSSSHSVVLSAAPHGESAQVVLRLLEAADKAGVKLTVVDASADFRFSDADAWAAVYGKPHPTPELLDAFTCAVPEQLGDIATPHAAHPGCFATSMLLGIVPLVAAGLAEPRAFVSAVTGSTGAGRSPRETTHHPVRQSNLFAYQPLVHRHQPEVAALVEAATGRALDLKFVPHSGPFARGIHATVFLPLAKSAATDDVVTALDAYYQDAALVSVLDSPPRMKDIAGGCHAALGASVAGDTITVFSVIDNLLKGAAGGSIQWVNRLLGLPDATGLDAPIAGWI